MRGWKIPVNRLLVNVNRVNVKVAKINIKNVICSSLLVI